MSYTTYPIKSARINTGCVKRLHIIQCFVAQYKKYKMTKALANRLNDADFLFDIGLSRDQVVDQIQLIKREVKCTRKPSAISLAC